MIAGGGTTRPLRIAVVLPDLRPGGAEKLHVLLAAEWLRLGFSVNFVLRQRRGALLDQLPQGAGVVDLRARRVRNAVPALASYLRSNPPDVLLVAMWPLTTAAVLAGWLARYRGRLVVSDHSPLSLAYGGRGWWHRLFLSSSIRLAYARADVRIAVTSGVADDLATLSGLDRRLFRVIHNPVAGEGAGSRNLELPALLRRRCGPVILTVGTLKKVKRQDLIISAFARIKPSFNATLCIVGDGPERNRLVSQAASAGLGGRVVFPGHVSDPAPWYAHADVFVLASSYEGFGNVLVEAMAHGLAIVSTDCPVGPREVLAGGRYGRLVPIDDAGALANAIEEVLEAPPDPGPGREWARTFAPDVVSMHYVSAMINNNLQLAGEDS